jgi:hypothetical protein
MRRATSCPTGGIENRFEIFKKHRNRYAPGVTHNLEHVFSLAVPEPLPVTLDPAEHLKTSRVVSRDGNRVLVEQKGEFGFFFYR